MLLAGGVAVLVAGGGWGGGWEAGEAGQGSGFLGRTQVGLWGMVTSAENQGPVLSHTEVRGQRAPPGMGISPKALQPGLGPQLTQGPIWGLSSGAPVALLSVPEAAGDQPSRFFFMAAASSTTCPGTVFSVSSVPSRLYFLSLFLCRKSLLNVDL